MELFYVRELCPTALSYTDNAYWVMQQNLPNPSYSSKGEHPPSDPACWVGAFLLLQLSLSSGDGREQGPSELAPRGRLLPAGLCRARTPGLVPSLGAGESPQHACLQVSPKIRARSSPSPGASEAARPAPNPSCFGHQ